MHSSLINRAGIPGFSIFSNFFLAWSSWKSAIQVLFIATILASVSVALAGGDWHASAYLFVWAFSAWFVGFLLGLIFAIPRARQRQPEGEGSGYLVNNNLVDISDWLTKIIAGLGLVHLHEARPFLGHLGRYIAQGGASRGFVVDAGLGLAVVVGFIALGFLSGYIGTRLNLQALFAHADHEVTNLAQTPQGAQVAKAQLSNAGDITAARATGVDTDAIKVAAMPLEGLVSANDVGLWARAQLQIGNFPAAIAGYNRALSLSPDNPQYLAELGLAYSNLGQYPEAQRHLQRAKGLLRTEADPVLWRNICQWLTFVLLYLPDGADRAREEGEAYLAAPGTIPSEGILVNLACAYGQLLKGKLTNNESLTSLPKGSEEARFRDRALELIKTTLVLDPELRPFLRRLAGLDRAKEDGQSTQDDDLTVFIGHPSFQELMGEPRDFI
jgi:tetratricopeptide (TPR) repeat protein